VWGAGFFFLVFGCFGLWFWGVTCVGCGGCLFSEGSRVLSFGFCLGFVWVWLWLKWVCGGGFWGGVLVFTLSQNAHRPTPTTSPLPSPLWQI